MLCRKSILVLLVSSCLAYVSGGDISYGPPEYPTEPGAYGPPEYPTEPGAYGQPEYPLQPGAYGPSEYPSEQGIYGSSSDLIKYNVISDEICQIPNHKISVQYDTGYRVLQGNFIPSQALNDTPYVQVPDANSPDLYTIMLLNPDYPTVYNPFFGSDYIYWLVVNIPGSAVDLGQTILSYQTPTSGPNSGYHRYIFLYYKQVGPIYVQLVPARTYFSSFDFARDFGMNTEPFAATFFISSDNLGPQNQYWGGSRNVDECDDLQEYQMEQGYEDEQKAYTSAPVGGYPPTNSEQGTYGPSSNLIKYRLVGDVLCKKPPYKMQISYPSGYQVLEGNYIPVPAANKAPAVWVPKAESPCMYTIIMIGPDYPTPTDPMMFGYLHWVVTNIPGSAVEQGTQLIEYQGPVIPPNTGYHRHLFLYLKQVDGPVGAPLITSRTNFAVFNFARTYKLQIIAANFFISSNL